MMQQVSMSQTVNWMAAMYQVERSRGPGKTPGEKSNLFSNTYFTVCQMVCALFIINMFVGVVCSAYNRQKDKIGKIDTITDQ